MKAAGRSKGKKPGGGDETGRRRKRFGRNLYRVCSESRGREELEGLSAQREKGSLVAPATVSENGK